jgi:GAF domain-containing protein
LVRQSTPLVGSSGQLLGMLSTHYRQPRDLSRDELNGIDEVAQQLTIGLEEQLRRFHLL